MSILAKTKSIWSTPFLYSLAVSGLLTFLAVSIQDQLVPFYSFVFSLGTASIFFFSITYGSAFGIYQAAGVFSLAIWVHATTGSIPLNALVIEALLLALFFSALAVLPNFRAYILSGEIRSLDKQTREMEKKVKELSAVVKEEYKKNVKERSTHSRELAAKYSSRNTVFAAFARGVLQASSVREILNLLFYNLTKVFGAEQCGMLIRVQSGDELIVTRIVHPEHERIENTRCSTELPGFREILENKELMVLPEPTLVTDDIEAELIFPVLFENEVYAIFTLSKLKSGPVDEESAQFIGALAELTTLAIEQLKMATTQ